MLHIKDRELLLHLLLRCCSNMHFIISSEKEKMVQSQTALQQNYLSADDVSQVMWVIAPLSVYICISHVFMSRAATGLQHLLLLCLQQKSKVSASFCSFEPKGLILPQHTHECCLLTVNLNQSPAPDSRSVCCLSRK